MAGIRRTSNLGTRELNVETINSDSITVENTIPSITLGDERNSPNQFDALGRINFGNSVGGANNNIGSASISAILYGSNTTDTGLDIATGSNGSTSTAMQFDNNGRVKMPKQPSFMARLGTGQTYTVTGGQAFAFNDVLWNVGNHYNPSNGRFTVPISGKYLIFAGLMQQATGTGFFVIEFYRNGTFDYNLPTTSVSSSSSETGVSLGSIANLTAGDYIVLATYKSFAGTLGNGGGTFDWGEGRNYFGAHLIA